MSKHKYKVEMVAHGATLAEAFDRLGEMMDVEYAYPVQRCRVGSYGWVSVKNKDDDNKTEEKPSYDELESSFCELRSMLPDEWSDMPLNAVFLQLLDDKKMIDYLGDVKQHVANIELPREIVLRHLNLREALRETMEICPLRPVSTPEKGV